MYEDLNNGQGSKWISVTWRTQNAKFVSVSHMASSDFHALSGSRSLAVDLVVNESLRDCRLKDPCWSDCMRPLSLLTHPKCVSWHLNWENKEPKVVWRNWSLKGVSSHETSFPQACPDGISANKTLIDSYGDSVTSHGYLVESILEMMQDYYSNSASDWWLLAFRIFCDQLQILFHGTIALGCWSLTAYKILKFLATALWQMPASGIPKDNAAAPPLDVALWIK